LLKNIQKTGFKEQNHIKITVLL